MTDFIFVPVPKQHYDAIVARSGGAIDPVRIIQYQLEAWIDIESHHRENWTEDGFKAWAAEYDVQVDEFGIGTLDDGYQWGPLFLPNGTKLRTTYKGVNQYAEVRAATVYFRGAQSSPSSFAGSAANHTARNAWRDLWVKRPGHDWEKAIVLRRNFETGRRRK